MFIVVMLKYISYAVLFNFEASLRHQLWILQTCIFQIWGDQECVSYAKTLDFLNLVNPLTSITNPSKVNVFHINT